MILNGGEDTSDSVVEFVRWIAGRWNLLHELFRSPDKTARFFACREVGPKEFAEFLWWHGFEGNAMQVFKEIESEGKIGNCSPSTDGTITLSLLHRFEKRGQIFTAIEEGSPVRRFARLLSDRRGGSVLRAWYLDIDLRRTGRVAFNDFVTACRQLKQASEVRLIWSHCRPKGSQFQPLEFREVEPEEAHNLDKFIEVVIRNFGELNLDHTWLVIDEQNRGFVSCDEFEEAVCSLGYEGDAMLLYRGLDFEGLGHLARTGLDYVEVMARADFNSQRSRDAYQRGAALRRRERAISGARGAERTMTSPARASMQGKPGTPSPTRPGMETKRYRAKVMPHEFLETNWEAAVDNVADSNRERSIYDKRYFVDYFDRPVRAQMHAQLQAWRDRRVAAELDSHKDNPWELNAPFKPDNKGKIIDFYRFTTDVLGEGQYGAITRVQHHATMLYYAVKELSKSRKKNIRTLKTEVLIMKQIEHPNIVRLHDTFQDYKNIFLVLEILEGRELFERITETKHFREDQVASIMQQVFEAVSYLHHKRIMHRDIKPENWLFSDPGPIDGNTLKLIDFSCASKCEPGEFLKTRCGATFFISPQVIAGKYDHAADIWSCGVIVYILLSGCPPFYGEDDSEILNKVFEGQYDMSSEDWQYVSDEGKAIVQWCLQKDPRQRCTASQALDSALNWELIPPNAEVSLTASNMMNNLNQFRAANALKKAALSVMVSNLNEEQIRQLQEAFTSLDMNGDGTLSITELKAGLDSGGYLDVLPELRNLLQEMDGTENAGLNYTEFLATMLDKKFYAKEDMYWKAFRKFDKDGSGAITYSELKQLFGEPAALGASEASLQAVLRETDVNGDGKIDFQEFMNMMRSVEMTQAGIGRDSQSPTRGEMLTKTRSRSPSEARAMERDEANRRKSSRGSSRKSKVKMTDESGASEGEKRRKSRKKDAGDEDAELEDEKKARRKSRKSKASVGELGANLDTSGAQDDGKDKKEKRKSKVQKSDGEESKRKESKMKKSEKDSESESVSTSVSSKGEKKKKADKESESESASSKGEKKEKKEKKREEGKERKKN